MDADLDLLLTAVYVTAEADDLLLCEPKHARRSVTDADVVTLCVAQAIMGIPSDRRFLAVARKHLRHLFPTIPGQAACFKRRRRLPDTPEWLIGIFASHSPGFYDELLLADSAPVECARSRERVKRSAPSDVADNGYRRSHSRFFWGFRLHGIFAPDGTPRAVTVASPKRDEREVACELLARARRRGGETLIGDKRHAGGQFAEAVSELDATILRPKRQDEPGGGPHPAAIHQRIESIFWTCKGTLTLERHGARTLAGLRARVLQRLLTLAAAMALNHQLGRPSRALVGSCA
jgi:hypothetical protein